MGEPALSDVVQFENFRLDRRCGGLFRQDGSGRVSAVPIGARALDVLSVLAARHGELVSKQEIMNAVWPGVTVEEHNLAVQISALRRVVDDGRTGDSCIQTVAGKGYRLVRRHGPANFEPSAAPAADPPSKAAAPALPQSRLGWLAAALGGLTLAALVALSARLGGWIGNPAAPPRLSIAVLPFANLSADRNEDYLADAITEDLTTDLSRVQGTFVVARQTAYAYQGKAADVRKVGDELGVRYVVEGSVRKLGSVLRVNAQLVASETGAHLWADRFDEPIKDLSAGQDEIVRRIGQTLNVALTDVESARSKRERPTNPDAFDLIIRARALVLHPMGPRENAERVSLYERALQIDPTSTLAMAALAETLTRQATTPDQFERAAKLIADAAAINPNYLHVLSSTGFLLMHQGRYVEAISTYQRLLREYPNAHFAYNQIADCLIRLGRAEEAIPMIETAIHLEPQSPFNWSRYDNLNFALLLAGRDEESIVWAQRALAANPNNGAGTRAQFNLRLAAAYARLGQIDEAGRAVAEANRIWPYDTVRMHFPDDLSSRTYVAQIERYQASLRLAGHRDHVDESAEFGVEPDDRLREILAGLTPTTTPGATTIRTADLARLLVEQKPVVIDPLLYSWGRSIPSAIGLQHAGWGATHSAAMESRLRNKMRELTKDDLAAPIVAVGWNAERFDGRNLALRLVALGYTNVYWYRGGREAWEAAGMPESEIRVLDW